MDFPGKSMERENRECWWVYHEYIDLLAFYYITNALYACFKLGCPGIFPVRL